MFRDLAKCTARLKGGRYDGAVISTVVWENTPGVASREPEVLVDKHKMLRVRAVDASGRLTITMLLGRSAPLPAANGAGSVKLAATVVIAGDTAGTAGTSAAAAREPAAELPVALPRELAFSFTAAEILDFVTAIDDTNPLHRAEFLSPPLVPGLAIVERILAACGSGRVQSLAMKFTAPSFAGDNICVTLTEG